MAHAVVNAALAAAQGKNGKGVIATAAGAGAGELTGVLSRSIYGKTPEAMSETEKQTVSALATVASGLAGGLTGDSRANATAAAQAGFTTVTNNALSGPNALEKRGIELALSKTGLTLHPRTPEEVTVLEERRSQLNQLDAEVDKYVQDACSQGRALAACQEASSLVQGLKASYSDYMGKLTYRELNQADYAKVSQIVANTTADKWDYAIDNYAKSQNISYQEAKDKFALVINVNQAADIAGIFYGLKGYSEGKGSISTSLASTMKQMLSKYDEFKQNIATSTKGNNGTLAIAGTGNVSVSAGNSLPPNVNLSTGVGGSKGSPIPVKDPVTASNGLNYQSNPKHTINPPRNAGIEPKNSLSLFESSVSVNAKNQKVMLKIRKHAIPWMIVEIYINSCQIILGIGTGQVAQQIKETH